MIHPDPVVQRALRVEVRRTFPSGEEKVAFGGYLLPAGIRFSAHNLMAIFLST